MMRHLPVPCNEMRKLCCEIIGVQREHSGALEMIDPYHDYNRPFEYTVFAECFEFKVSAVFLTLAWMLIGKIGVNQDLSRGCGTFFVSKGFSGAKELSRTVKNYAMR